MEIPHPQAITPWQAANTPNRCPFPFSQSTRANRGPDLQLNLSAIFEAQFDVTGLIAQVVSPVIIGRHEPAVPRAAYGREEPTAGMDI